MKKIYTILLIISILLIVCLTMLPFPSLSIGIHRGGLNVVPFKTIKIFFAEGSLYQALLNNVGNIILFIPFGITLPLAIPIMGKFHKTVLIGALFSITIECIQLAMPLRWSDIDDVILNTFGTALGYIIFVAIDKISGHNSK